jgi:hypothetical protein
MRYLLLCFAALTTTLVWACGKSPAESDGDGGACMPDENLAGACRAPAQCVNEDTSCTCDVNAGVFQCTNVVVPPWLPPVRPKNGECCEAEGVTCGGYDICAPICHCQGGKWSCVDPDCPLFFCPDPVSKLAGQFCDDRIGDTCQDSNGCAVQCVCQLRADLARGVWMCAAPPCPFQGDAGPPADAGSFDASFVEAGSAADGG